MRKRSLVIFCLAFGLFAMLVSSCNKSNHDTLVLLGSEDYIAEIDDIYPWKYRLEWPEIAEQGYYSLKIDTTKDNNGIIISIDTTLIPIITEYFYPPDMTGEFLIKGIRRGGNETLHNGSSSQQDPDSSLYNKIPVDGMNIKLTITQQQNAYAHVKLQEYNDYGENMIETDHVYLYGDHTTGLFSLCFDAIIPMGSMQQNYAYLVTGVLGDTTIITSNNDTILYGIKDVRFWQLVKGRSGASQIYINTGGQRFYMDSINFAIRTKSPDEL